MLKKIKEQSTTQKTTFEVNNLKLEEILDHNICDFDICEVQLRLGNETKRCTITPEQAVILSDLARNRRGLSVAEEKIMQDCPEELYSYSGRGEWNKIAMPTDFYENYARYSLITLGKTSIDNSNDLSHESLWKKQKRRKNGY